jgi:hypothetical protein
MRSRSEPFDARDIDQLLEQAERDPEASAELEFLASVAAAAELVRASSGGLAHRPAEPRRAVRPRILAAVASVLLVLGAWFLREHTRPVNLARIVAEAPPYVASELRGDGRERDFAKAMEPYAHGDWNGARAALETFLRERPGHGPARFYLAAVREQLAEPGAAEALYREVTGVPDPLLAGHARLRLAALLMARGGVQAARAELEALAREDGELAPNARELLRTLPER